MGLIIKNSNFYKKSAKIKSKQNNYKKIKTSVVNFIETKKQDQNAQYGSSDTSINAKSPLGRAIPKLHHAHLTQDISIWYKIENNILYLYGLLSHSESGTGNTPNMNIQKQIGQKFKNQTFENKIRLLRNLLTEHKNKLLKLLESRQ